MEPIYTGHRYFSTIDETNHENCIIVNFKYCQMKKSNVFFLIQTYLTKNGLNFVKNTHLKYKQYTKKDTEKWAFLTSTFVFRYITDLRCNSSLNHDKYFYKQKHKYSDLFDRFTFKILPSHSDHMPVLAAA